MRDYEGDMSYFQNQLTRCGISKEECDMDNYIGLSFNELQGIVDCVIRQKVGAKS